MSKIIRDCFVFIQLFSVIGPGNLHHTLNQSEAKNQNKRDLVACVFPRFMQLACFHLESSLASDDVNICSDWLLGLLSFLDTQLTTALTMNSRKNESHTWTFPSTLVKLCVIIL